MKAGLCALFFILMTGVCHGAGKCNLTSPIRKDQYFPDIFLKAKSFYQMTVDFTVVKAQQSNYYVEYYDVDEKKGRLDILESGKTTKYYYFSDVLEAFLISGSSCTKHNSTAVPDFMGGGMYDWNFQDKERMIHGPSAMFRYAYTADKNNHKNVVYMGNSSISIRGIPAQYWRRCLGENVTIDYYFSAAYHEDLYGVKNLKEIPLRITIDGYEDLLPQNYEIMSFAPDYLDDLYTFELPVGLGCGRTPRDDDIDIPTFDGKSLFVYSEAVYTDYLTAPATSYSSNFMFAFDITSDFTSYFYTPWKKSGGTLEAGNPMFVVYDAKNKYIYETNYATAECTISNSKIYAPKYTLPGGENGYVSLTDASVFYPNNEFFYLGEGVDRGYKVNIYEVLYPNYPLGDRLVKNTVVTHYYLKDGEIKRGPFPVEQALTRIRMAFNGSDDKGKQMNAELNFNFYGFSTQIDPQARIFDISNCFRNDDDMMTITIGFDADESQLDEIADEIISIEYNVRNDVLRETGVTPSRLPYIMVDMSEGIFVTLLILERPPFNLDFDTPKENTVVSGVSAKQGITELPECAYLCFENDDDCWGFAHCGATCYIGAGDTNKGKIASKAGCQFYNRTNFNNVPRLQVVKRNLERLVKSNQIKLALAKKNGEEFFLTATYIGPAVFGESEELFELMGLETNSRFRVVKVASKLNSDAGETVKNFGRLTYGECQRLCLDYKGACETVSYCLSNNECILSETHGEDIPATQITEDSFCNLLSRQYSDSYTRSPGNVLSQNAIKTVKAVTEEDCARACSKETSFKCLSFDHCPASKEEGCRLHNVHYLDIKNNESAVTKEAICGHYSKKFSYDFERKSNARIVGSENSVQIATAVTLEECAKLCNEFPQGKCHGFEVCQEKTLTSFFCSVITIKKSEMKTSYNALCTHYDWDRSELPEEKEDKKPVSKNQVPISNATAGGVGFLLFVIGCVIGGLIVFGVAYYRVNRSRQV